MAFPWPFVRLSRRAALKHIGRAVMLLLASQALLLTHRRTRCSWWAGIILFLGAQALANLLHAPLSA
ncbi:MAG: hypothetical protein HY703_08940 [Gemmatimonadetes bacterium]|nr:hypothetical protein [Gemmatimonadota bacterium]